MLAPRIDALSEAENIRVTTSARVTRIRGFLGNFEARVEQTARLVNTDLCIEKAAKGLIRGKKVDDGLLNMVEMAFRAYDPRLSCATHSLPGQMPLFVELVDDRGAVVQIYMRG